MNLKARRAIYIGLGLSAFVGAVFVLLAEKADIVVSSDTWARKEVAGGEKAYLLRAGTSAPVAKCIDTKSYMSYQILLPDGRFAYLDSGSGHLKVRSIFSGPFDQPIVWNCF